MQRILKRALDLRNPLPWYLYILYILIVIALVLILSFILCFVIYSAKDLIGYFMDEKFVSRTFLSRRSFLPLYALIVTMVATMTALSGPALAVYWSVKQDQRTVINLSYDLIKEWREERMTMAVFKIGAYFESGTDYDKLKHDLFLFTENKENLELRIALRVLLNYMEGIAGACIANPPHVDTELIHRYFETVFIGYYDKLLPYINAIRNSRKQDRLREHITLEVYSDFTNLAREWRKINSKRS